MNEALDCVLCENYEWCVPGFDTSYWNVDQLCNSAEESQSSLCTLNNGSVSTAFLGKCIRPDECPSLYDISQNQNKAQCRFPNRGVKCHGVSAKNVVGFFVHTGACVVSVHLRMAGRFLAGLLEVVRRVFGTTSFFRVF